VLLASRVADLVRLVLVDFRAVFLKRLSERTSQRYAPPPAEALTRELADLVQLAEFASRHGILECTNEYATALAKLRAGIAGALTDLSATFVSLKVEVEDWIDEVKAKR
jgi:hypothetical protein